MQSGNLSPKENNKRFSTPKFNLDEVEKEKNTKNNLSRNELSSFDDSKYDSKKFDFKNPQEYKGNEKSDTIKSSNEGFIFKDSNNFSINSLINNIDLDCNLNINNIMNNKEKNDKISKETISFCDKSDNYSFKNEIIYKDKDINNSSTSKKDNEDINKEKNDIKINSFTYKPNEDTKHKKKEKNIKICNNLNINKILKELSLQNSPKRYKNINIKYDISPFKYNLPLENDKSSAIKDFFDFHVPFDDNEKNENRTINANKSQELNNINLNLEKINEINKKEKIYEENDSSRNNIILKSRNYMTYSKKKVKRSKTEKYYKINNILSIDPNGNNIIIHNKSFLEKGIKNNKFLNKITIRKKVLHSCRNYTKIKKKFKNSSINSSNKEIQENNELLLSEKSNDKIIIPRKKLEIIVKNIESDMNINYSNKTTEGNLYQNNNFQLKQNTDFNEKNNFDIKSNNQRDFFNKNNENNNYIKNSLNSLSTKPQRFINKKIIKSGKSDLYDSLINFKIKRIHDTKDIDDNKYSTNLTKESSNYNKDIIIENKTINSKNIRIYKKSNYKEILNNKKYNNKLSRNINNLYSSQNFNGSKDTFNRNRAFKTMNFENINIKNQISDKKILLNQIKSKIKIDSSLQLRNKNKNVKINFYNNDDTKIKNKNNNNTYSIINLNKKDKKQFPLQKKNTNKINNNSTYNKPNNLIFNYNAKKKVIPKENKIDIYSKIKTDTFNRSNTDKNIKINYESMNIDNISNKSNKNFINDNDSNNSFNIINDSQYNKIRVNTRNIQKKLPTSPNITYNMVKKNSYWKIYKKPKNSCLLDGRINIINKNDNINNYKNNNSRENSQFIIFKNNRINNLIKKEDNSSSINLKEQKNYYSINENINIEQEKPLLSISQQLNDNQIYKNSRKIYKKNQNNSFRNKSSKIRNKLKEENDNNKNKNVFNYKFNLNEDIIRFSIQRNNMNNQIIKEFSVIVGDKNKSMNLKEINEIGNNNFNNNNENKKTIINVNQYYPNYFINTSEIIKNKKKDS